jgi:hypothetical protein
MRTTANGGTIIISVCGWLSKDLDARGCPRNKRTSDNSRAPPHCLQAPFESHQATGGKDFRGTVI